MTLRPLVFDMYHGDASEERHGKLVDLADFNKAYAAGWRGVIHKATEGARNVDPLYLSRRAKAIKAGLKWGAYHFMRPGDVGDQVTAFLRAVGPSASAPATRYVLDYEDDKLALWQAIQWLEIIKTTTRQTPWIYGGGVIKDQVAHSFPPAIGQYPLWLAEYSVGDVLPRPWKKFVLWQRSGDGEGPGPHVIPGIGLKEDVSWFDGSDADLATCWIDTKPLAGVVA
jgi:lysozyme